MSLRPMLIIPKIQHVEISSWRLRINFTALDQLHLTKFVGVGNRKLRRAFFGGWGKGAGNYLFIPIAVYFAYSCSGLRDYRWKKDF